MTASLIEAERPKSSAFTISRRGKLETAAWVKLVAAAVVPADVLANCKLEFGDFKLERGKRSLEVEENPGSSIGGLGGVEERETGSLDFAGINDSLLDVSGALEGKL